MRHTKILTTTAIIIGILLAAQVALGNGISNLPVAKQGAEAQMMGGNDISMMKSGDRMRKMSGGNITGSVDLISVISEAIGSKVNVSLSDAATSAETSVGNESHAVSAELGENSGFLVYNMMMHGMGMDKQGMMSPGMMGPGMMMGPPSGMMGGYPR